MNNFIKKLADIKTNILSGLTVALALVPEAVAFSFLAGVAPLIGLYSAFIVGLITGILGGRPGMISGATGALAIVVVSLVKLHGVEYLFATVVLMGILQLLAGVFKLGRFARLIPHSVLMGAVNGLAIVIFIAQLTHLQLQGLPLLIMLGLVGLTMLIMYIIPKITKVIPPGLAGIGIVSLLVALFGIPTTIVADLAPIGGGFPSLHIPSVPFNFETLRIVFPYALIMALVGLIESLITLQLVDEVTESRGRSNKECIAQGLANIVTGFFSGMGGCAMIGQSMINVQSGGRKRLSSIAAALFLLIFILFASSLIESIPIAALVGVMMIVVIGTFEWSSFRILRKIHKSDAFVLIFVSILTVFTDLAVSVISGVVISALVFAWKKALRIEVKTHVAEDGVKHYQFKGPLFFGSAHGFLKAFDVKNDPETIAIDLKESRVCDHSAIEAIKKTLEKYRVVDKAVSVNNLSPDCSKAIDKMNIF